MPRTLARITLMCSPRSMDSATIGNSISRVQTLSVRGSYTSDSALRACVNLHNRYHLAVDDISDVECRVRMGDRPADAGGEQVFFRQAPVGDYGAHFSTPFIAAVALLKGRLALVDFDGDALHDPAVLKLSGKVRRTDDPNSGRPRYRIRSCVSKDQRRETLPKNASISTRATWKIPSRRTTFRKIRYNALRTVNQDKADALLRQVMAIEQVVNMRELTEQLCV